jgi:hypothetical protein
MLCHTQLCTQSEVKKDVVNGRIMMAGCYVEVNMGGEKEARHRERSTFKNNTREQKLPVMENVQKIWDFFEFNF